MLTKLLIANRGEIACRIIKTAKKLGIQTVAIYSQADTNALHVSLADEAYYVGPAPSKDSYLQSQRIIDIAIQCGATLIHPGYGFLSENADFANLCQQNAIQFIGPPVSAIEAMGSKSAAKQIMEEANVPLVPGYHGDQQDADILRHHAQAIGYPVLLKAAAGGGGKGMRQVWSDEEFTSALDAAKREALSSFADDHMLVEKYLTQPRHVEIQVFCDSLGHGIYLFERDCSVQRRHQKVIEEAPAPGLSQDLREKMGEAALKAAQAINYVGAGTVEFLLDSDGSFYFMEMNTRLQVEHPVTEMITGQDLVEWQIKVAQGLPLPLQQDQLALRGHAFEARVYAEDPNNDFLPATGTLHLLQPPQTSHLIRVDTGVVQGDEVSVFYDPMIAKLVVWGENRQSALAGLIRALNHYYVDGVVTNIPFLTRVASHPSFASGDFDTGFIEKHQDALFKPIPSPDNKLIAIAALLMYQNQIQTTRTTHGKALSSPWLDLDNWRINLPHTETIKLSFNELEFAASITPIAQSNEYTVTVNGETLICALQPHGHVLDIRVNQINQQLVFNQINQRFKLFAQGETFEFVYQTHDLGLDDDNDPQGDFSAPMNGTIVTLLAKTSALVTSGQPLLVMEAMKMEHTIHAPCDGVVEEYFFQPGELVDGGATLLSFTPTED